MSELRDAFGRRIDYLRVSVTDRCNLRCAYCMPAAGVAWAPRGSLLSDDEIARVVRAAAALGVRKVRLTGGEPLARPDLPSLVRAIARIGGIEDISLTTNGTLLEKLAAPLADAGLKRVNVSLDSLDPARFRRITRFGDLARVWRGIAAAERAGLAPIKLNTVVMRGVNDDELPDLARLTLSHPWHARFIELMPVGNTDDWGEGFPAPADRYVSVQEMLSRLGPLGLARAEGAAGNGPARAYRLPGAPGAVGFISPLGQHFCADCNRLRLTADGRLRPCLLTEGEIETRGPLRQGRDVADLIRLAVERKPAGHTLATASGPGDRLMCQIGG
jgi:cyclic pyranopterin phosphate synthase